MTSKLPVVKGARFNHERNRYEYKVRGRWISRQRLQQLRNAARGKCQYCSEPATLYKALCNRHAKVYREVQRRFAGCKPWRKDGKGYLEVTACRVET